MFAPGEWYQKQAVAFITYTSKGVFTELGVSVGGVEQGMGWWGQHGEMIGVDCREAGLQFVAQYQARLESLGQLKDHDKV